MLLLLGCEAQQVAAQAGAGAPPRVLYGTVSASKTVGTIETGEYDVHAEGYFELRYSRSLRSWQGNSDAVRVNLSGHQRIVSGTGEVITYEFRGAETARGTVEINEGEDGEYTIRFFSDPIEYTSTSSTGHTRQRRGGPVATDWGLQGNPMPARGEAFEGSGIYEDPDEEGLRGRGRTRLSWKFSAQRPSG